MEKLRSFNLHSKANEYQQFFDLQNTNLIYMLWFLNFVIFYFIFQLCERFLNHLPAAQSIQQHDVKLNFLSRVVSSIHAILATTCALLILYFDKNIYANELLYKSYGITFTLCLVIGYLTYDLLLMAYCKEVREYSAVCHHLVAIIAYINCITAGVFPLIAIVRLTSEFSTPFINNRWFMLTVNQKNTKLFQYNAYMIFLAFLTCRILPIIPIWTRLMSLIGTPTWNEIDIFYKFICISTSVPLDILNLFWFYKIIKIFLKYRKEINKTN